MTREEVERLVDDVIAAAEDYMEAMAGSSSSKLVTENKEYLQTRRDKLLASIFSQETLGDVPTQHQG